MVQRERAFLAVGVLLAGFLMVGAAGAASASQSESTAAMEARLLAERRGATLDEESQKAGALGVYWAENRYTIVLPRNVNSINNQMWTSLGIEAVAIQHAAFTAADVGRIYQMVADKARQTPGKGWSAFVDLQNRIVRVEGPNDAGIEEDFERAFGSSVNYSGDGSFDRLSRADDTEPFWGGANVFRNLWGDCTSGFSVKKSNGVRYMLTAGHCYAPGVDVYTPAGTPFGVIRFQAPFPNSDVELIGDRTYGTRIYTGEAIGGDAGVGGAGNPIVGGTYCTGGAFSFEECNKQVEAVNTMACDPEGNCTTGLTRFTNGASLMVGDSGGPFYFDPGGSCIYARGTIVGKIAGTTKGVAQMWTRIAASFNVSIVTSPSC